MGMRVGVAALVAALAVLVMLVAMGGLARASSVILYADFEAGTGGWVSSHDLQVLDAPPGPDGPHAAWVTAVDLSHVSIVSQYWLTPAAPARMYAADAWLHAEDPAMSSVALSIEFLDVDGNVLMNVLAAPANQNVGGFQQVSTAFTAAPPNTAYLRVVAGGTPSGIGARFGLDGVSVTEVIPEEPPFEPEPPPPAPPPPVPAVAVPRPTATPRPAPTARPTVTPTPRPAPVHVLAGLDNARFEGGLTGWEVSRGRIAVQEVLPGFGVSLVLTATGATTAWVEQRVAGIDPDAWYEASVVLVPFDGVEAAWLRIAWYASDDASGAQLATHDSPVVVSPPANAMSHEAQLVGTGPVQPPIEAGSARIRILIRPTSQAGGSVAIDDIEFRPAEPLTPVPPPAPATPEVTPAPAATPSAAPSAPPVPVPAASPVASSGAMTGPAAPPQDAAVDPATEAAQRWLRISELMPDPVQSGGDADYEWIEIVNLGPRRVSMEGMLLVDNRAATPLPAVSLDAGEIVVIAAPLAEVATSVRVPIIGNGLGNTGDALALLSAGGVEVDRLAYGNVAPPPGAVALPAPGAGRSIERWFTTDGVLLGARVSTTPTPGTYLVPEDMPAEMVGAGEGDAEAGDSEPRVIVGTTGPGVTWVVLVALAAGMLGGAAVQHGAAILHERRASRPGIEPAPPFDVPEEQAEPDAACMPQEQ